MNDALRMQVSAFVDGELPENETELLLRRLSQDAALRQLVAQYLVIGRAIRREREIPGMHELRGRISNALGQEPVETVPSVGRRPARYLKPAAGLAIAASVAAMAVVGLRALEEAPATSREALRADANAVEGYTQPRPEETVPARPSETLMQYYVRHGETSSDLGPNGILTRLVTLELRHGELEKVEPTRGNTSVDGADRGNDDGDDNDNDE